MKVALLESVYVLTRVYMLDLDFIVFS